MRFRPLLAVLGLLILTLAGVLLIPLLVAWGLDSNLELPAFYSTIGICLVVGLLFWGANRDCQKDLRAREAFAAVGLGWAVLSFFGALPFWIAPGGIPDLLDAYFETMSGFTTTGATILTDIEALPPGLLFWRSLTQWFGGMGIVLLTVAVLPLLGSGGMQMMRAEVPGPTAEKLAPRVAQTATMLWGLYFLLTLVVTGLLLPVMPWFDAVTLSFSTLATGGFATKNASIAHFDSAYVDTVITVFILIAGVNFVLHYRALFQMRPLFLRDSEFKFFLGLIVFSILFVTAMLHLGNYPDRIDNPEKYDSLGSCFRYASFQVASIGTGAGFVTADFDHWPNACRVVLIVLMVIGGCAGSTAGGIKIFRVLTLVKYGLREIALLVRPHAVLPIKIGGESIEREIISRVMGFLALWTLLFLCSLLLLSFILDPSWAEDAGSLTAVSAQKVSGALEDDHLLTALGATLATIGNVGPGIAGVGPLENFSEIPAIGKALLVFLMLLGRLEIYAVLVIFLPMSWRR
ncbi:MAG: TrkH family potassium uptake protein [Planctomycetota bacterium]